MKKVLGLDLGTNSIGWSLIESDFDKKEGKIIGAGVRIIPMGQDVLGKFDAGQSISQTAERTGYRSTRKLYHRNNLRRERLHRVLHILDFLPNHYDQSIDFEKRLGQFYPEKEVKLNYKEVGDRHEFIFQDSFKEMTEDFKSTGYNGPTPPDWTIYFLRQKALTTKISKEELAWIILNFNQKRGYYQLRGEEQDEDNNKQFVQLKVQDVEDSGEKVKGNILYNVTFTNGWIYDKQITKTEEWIGREKEFIVTIKELKNGDLKYSYKAVNSEEDWAAIKAKTQQEIDKSKLTIGQFIYQTLLEKPSQKIRGKLIKTIERKYYKEELVKILEEQAKHHPELQDKTIYNRCITNLYSKNEAHRNNIQNKDFVHLFVNDIIFYQRPLKSKKSTIGTCRFEYRTYLKTDEKGNKEREKEYIKAIPKSHPLFQEFRLWQFCNNIRIYESVLLESSSKKEDADITSGFLQTEDDYTAFFEYLNEKNEVDQKNVLEYLLKKKTDLKKVPKEELAKYVWNYDPERKYPCNQTNYLISSRLKKVEGVDLEKFLTKEKEVEIWHIIYSVKDRNEYHQAIKTFAKKNGIDEDSFFDNFSKIPPFDSDYSSYSFKALNKLLPLLRSGKYWEKNAFCKKTNDRINKIITAEYDENIQKRVREKAIDLTEISDFKGLPLWLASYIVYDRHSEGSNVDQWTAPEQISKWLEEFSQHSLRNPIVEKVITETMRVVRDIWNHYGNGEQSFFDEIHVELGRDMKNPAKKRKAMSKRMTENENTNQRIRELLNELMNDPDIEGDVRPYSPSQQEILKLYEDGIYSNPTKSFSKVSEDEIDKIRRKNSPTKADIIKYKLWLKQGYRSPYSGQVIPLHKLFTREYEIEHIIPQSRYFDNSLSNKVICERDINADKGNRTAYEYLKIKNGSPVESYPLLSPDEYEQNCRTYFGSNTSKLRNLLSEDIPEGFINRQLNDTRYISKYVKGLLANFVRGKDEKEETSVNLVSLSGAITSVLKKDWGLNDKWNEITAKRFQRLNAIYDNNAFGGWDDKINAFRSDVPDDIKKGFSKKRIDHRHHALDAIIIACCTKDHINYITSINTERKNHTLVSKLRTHETVNVKNKTTGKMEAIPVAKHYKHPWNTFSVDAKNALEDIVVSFKHNNRIINKANNKTWQWVEKDGILTKTRIKQTKGDNWAIRKPLHKETVSGIVQLQNVKIPNGKISTASRVSLTEIKNVKHIEKITDPSIRKILFKHLENYIDETGKQNYLDAFSPSGIEDMNKNIKELNGGRDHMPILKVRLYEIGSKFEVGKSGNNKTKYVETAKGTNLFFAVYWNDKKDKRAFETVPLNEVIEYQKQVAHLPRSQKHDILPKPELGRFMFTISPNDFVYVPNEEEVNNPSLVNFEQLSQTQINRIYKMVSCTGSQCFFSPASNATEIIKSENGTNAKNERIQLFNDEQDVLDENGKGIMIKNVCWKLSVDRIGNIKLASKKEYITNNLKSEFKNNQK